MPAETLVPTRQWAGPDRNFNDVQDAWSGGADIFAWWVNLFGANAFADDLRVATDNARAKALEAVSWTGTGALLWVRVVRVEHGDTQLVARGILGDGPLLVGLGVEPRDALFEHLNSDQLVVAPPPGWKFDEAASYFLWVTSDKPEGVVVPRGSMRELSDEVRAKFSELSLQHFSRKFRSGLVLSNVVSRAKRDLQDQQAKDALDKTLARIVESERRVRDIEKKLEIALREAADSNRALMLLNTLKGVLTVAQLGEMVATELNRSPAEFKNAPSGKHLLQMTQGIADKAEADRVSYVGMFEGSLEDFRTYMGILEQQLQEFAPPPGEVRQFLKSP